jgi:RND family efflux transporter MFP subunit
VTDCSVGIKICDENLSSKFGIKGGKKVTKKKVKILLMFFITIGIIVAVIALNGGIAGLKSFITAKNIPANNVASEGTEATGASGATGATDARKLPVTVESVHKGTIERKIPLGGLLKAQEQVFLAAKNPAFRIMHIPVKLGDYVSKGTPLVIFDSRELDLQIEQAVLAYERNKQLFEVGAVSKFQLEQAETALENLTLQKENCILSSPISGVIATVNAVEGQLAGATPLVSVVNIDQVELEVMVSESYISKIKKGEKVNVSIPSVAEEPFQGIITAVAPQVDARTKAFPVTLTIKNLKNRLKDGMYGEIQLVTDRKTNILVIPQFAVVDYEQKKVVYVVESDTAKMREVKLGLTLGEQAEVLSGLREGEMLIIEGQYGVREGSAVAPVMRGEQQ